MPTFETKYQQLTNKEWLYDQYVNRQFSAPEIADKIGCSKDAVRKALIKFGIPLRSAGESIVLKNKRVGYKSHKYPLLNDEKWLRERYLVEKLSTIQIAKLAGAQSNSVRQALLRFGIVPRNQSEGVTCNRIEDGFILNLDVINGCLLGDAGLRIWSHSGISLPCFYKKNKYYDHVNWVGGLLFGEEGSKRIKEIENIFRGKCFPGFFISSLTHKELLPLYKKWYPESNGFKKVIPADLEVNETVLLHWLLDDGTTSWRPERNNSVRLTFCSESFTLNDNNMLCEKINSKFSLKAKSSPIGLNRGTGWRIKIPESKVGDFFDIIGPCPLEVPSMKYKWKLSTKPQVA